VTPRPLAAFSPAMERVDRQLTQWLAMHGIALLRVSVAIIYLWFGILKFFPGMSPAQDLAARTIGVLSFGLVHGDTAVLLLATLETTIGIGLLLGRHLRVVLPLMLAQMAGTVTPMLLFPAETFTQAPIAPTLEGQYIIKNLVLISAALVLGATVRGGHLVADAGEER
jgi:uncharacterized membrane protein YkgB